MVLRWRQLTVRIMRQHYSSHFIDGEIASCLSQEDELCDCALLLASIHRVAQRSVLEACES